MKWSIDVGGIQTRGHNQCVIGCDDQFTSLRVLTGVTTANATTVVSIAILGSQTNAHSLTFLNLL
jgi:hypothetical protein